MGDLIAFEATLHPIEARYRSIVDQSIAGIAETDLEGRFVMVNDRFCAMTGYARSELLLRRMQDITHSDDLPDNLIQFRASVEDCQPFEIEKRYVRKDGSLAWVHNSVSSVCDTAGRPQAIVAVSVDITARKLGEAFSDEQQRVLEAIAAGRPFAECVVALTEAVGRLRSGAGACVCVANADRTAIGEVFGAHLPESFASKIRGVPINAESIGTCATAIHTGTPTACTDVQGSERWSGEWKAVCLAHGVRACQSTPVFDEARRAVASFFLCFTEPRQLDDWDRRLTEFGAHIAGIALARERALALMAQRRDAEYHLELLSNTVPAVICYLDVERRYRTVNDAYLRWFGVSREQMLGKTVREFIGDAAWQVTGPRFERAFGGETVEYEAEVPFRVAGTRWISAVYTPHRDAEGKVIGVIVHATDISERKRNEKALRDSEADARLLQSVGAELILQDDTQVIYERVVDAAAELMHSQHASLQLLERSAPGSERLKLLAFRGFNPNAVRFWDLVTIDGKSPCGMALITRERVIVPDVRTCGAMAGSDDLATLLDTGILAVQTTPLVSLDGKLVGMLSTHWNSPHAPTPAELRSLDLLARQAADLIEHNRVQHALRDADRRKDEFLATLAHELRNPLAPVRNGLHILRVPGGDALSQRKVVAMIERQVDHMVRLVDDLLEVSRITRGKIELRKEPVDVGTVVRNALETAGPMVDAAGHTLAVELPSKPLLIDADPVRLSQVITNLVNNAAKYSERNGRIVITARRDGDNVAIAVRDGGIGIPAEMLPRVFELFTQIDRTLGRAQGGLGIGLALVKHLVEMHGGSVEAKSDGPGCGSEFIVRIPSGEVVASPQSSSAPLLDSASAALANRRMLVVDDNRDAADSLASLLELFGASARTAYDGPSALTEMRSFRPHVMFLDLGMPGMDGCAVATNVRADPQFRDVALVAVTGWGQEEERRRTREAGFDHHLVKPVATETLIELLTSLSLEWVTP